MKTLVRFLAVCVGVWLLLAAAWPLRTQAQDERRRENFRGRDVVAGEVAVRLRPGAGTAALRALIDAEDDQPVGRGAWRRLRSRSRDVETLIAALSRRGEVLAVEPNYIVSATKTPDDPFFPLWGLFNTTTPGADIHATAAWDAITGSTANVVAVLDTGMDYTHPDLVANLWSAPAPFTMTLAGRTFTCPAGTHGINAIRLHFPSSTDAQICDPFDDHNQGHGTHVAGTIGATGNNGVGVVGVNWTTRIMPLKFLNSSGNGSTLDAVDLIDFAIHMKNTFGAAANVRVLNNSYGGGGSLESFIDGLNRAAAAEMLFVAAAGNAGGNNDATPFYPASYENDNVIAVAATTIADARASFSNYGATSVDLGAPGENIASTTPNNTYGAKSGTSMATPHVSGAAMLVLAACNQTTTQLRNNLLGHVDPVAALAGITVTGGRLNVDAALRSCTTLPTTTITSPPTASGYVLPASVSIEATATDPDGIAQVDFFANGVFIGSDTSNPYGLTWNPNAVGSYALTAYATDNIGVTGALSTAVDVTVAATDNSETLLTTQVPDAQNVNDGTNYELGVRLRADVDGQITKLRFYKGSLETGTHVGHVWATNGTLLATATFVNETASGWQEQILSSALAIQANVDYIVTVTTGTPGYFVAAWSQFANPVIHGHLRSVAAGGRYGPAGTMPATVSNANYFRDVVFVPGAAPPDVTAPTVTNFQPANGSTVSGAVAVSVDATDDVGVVGVQFQVDGQNFGSEDTTAPYGVTWDSTLVSNGTHTLTAIARDAAAHTTPASVSVTVNNTAQLFETLLTTQVPDAQNVNDGTNYELGVRLRADVDGQITKLRFYKGSLETGTHVGHVWATNGTLLATATFVNETASGWQEQILSSALAIQANVDYIVTVTTGTPGYFVAAWSQFANPVIHGHLRSVAAGGRYGPAGTMPATVSNANYFRDVVFVPGAAPPDVTAPTVTNFQPANGSTVSGAVAVSVDATDDVGVVGVQFQVDGQNFGSEDTTAPYGVTWDSTLVSNGTHTLTAIARDAAAHTTPASVSVTVNNTAQLFETLLTTQVPDAQNVNDGTNYELGVRLRSDVSGQVTKLRFYKGSQETGAHVGKIWTTSGQLLGSVTFANESASGWQEQLLPAPVSLQANVDYIVTVTTGTPGFFVSAWSQFTNPVINAHLRSVPSAGRYGPAGVMPTTVSNANYFRDVVFVPDIGSGELPVTATAYASGFVHPIAFVQDPTNASRQFIVEQGGRIRVVDNGVVSATDFLDLTTDISTGGERGLLGMALAPDYATSGRFFVNFTNPGGHTVVARFKRSANPAVADPLSRFDLHWGGVNGPTFIAQPFSNHNGGHLAFGPDGFLYIGLGDGGSADDPDHRSQNASEYLGKMLRINVNVADQDPVGYTVPIDNPFLDAVPVSALPEIWAFGLRNPWRYSFDDPTRGGTGALVIGDVGQGTWEEVDYEPANQGGRNYGWRNREGAHAYIGSLPTAYPGLTDPIVEYDHNTGRSITGGVVYRGTALGATFRGRYFYADYVMGRVWSVQLTIDQSGNATPSNIIEHTAQLSSGASLGNVSSFGTDNNGELYILNYAAGTVLRVVLN